MDIVDDDERFQLAGRSARRLVSQCRSHVRKTTARLEHYTDEAPRASAFAQDEREARAGKHPLAFQQRVHHVEALSNALLSHLHGLEVLMKHDTFYALPALMITRAIAEAAASCAWILHPGIDADERAARGYASLFRALDRTIAGTVAGDAARAREIRAQLVRQLGNSRVTVTWRERQGVTFDDVAQVTVGSAHAKTNYNITQRVTDEIPVAGDLYGSLSAFAHGEPIHVMTSWESPGLQARLIGVVTPHSVSAWSTAVRTWVGVDTTPVVNQADLDNLLRSMHPELRAEFAAQAAVKSAH